MHSRFTNRAPFEFGLKSAVWWFWPPKTTSRGCAHVMSVTWRICSTLRCQPIYVEPRSPLRSAWQA